MGLPPWFGAAGSDEVDEVTGYLACLSSLNISDERKAAFTKATIRGGWEWWNLSPAVQRQNTQGETSSGRAIVRAMLQCVGMRRGMDTILELPKHADGSDWLVCPRDGIPAHRIEFHELDHAALKTYFTNLMNEHFRDLDTCTTDAGPTEAMLAVPYGGEVQAQEDAEGGDGTSLNTGLLRCLTIASIDILSYKAMLQPDPVSEQPDEVALAELKVAGELGAAKARKAVQAAARDDQGVLKQGSKHADALLQGTRDKAVTYIQTLGLGDDPWDFIPVERRAVISRVICRSPVFTHVLKLCSERASKGERTLVMVGTPWIQL